jgi:thioredoxin 1
MRKRRAGALVEVSDEAQWAALLADSTAAGVPLLCQFSATWCRPCKVIRPVFEDLSRISDAMFAYVDIDELGDVALANNVSAIPHFAAFVRGTKQAQLVGPSEHALREFVAKVTAAAQ